MKPAAGGTRSRAGTSRGAVGSVRALQLPLWSPAQINEGPGATFGVAALWGLPRLEDADRRIALGQSHGVRRTACYQTRGGRIRQLVEQTERYKCLLCATRILAAERSGLNLPRQQRAGSWLNGPSPIEHDANIAAALALNGNARAKPRDAALSHVLCCSLIWPSVSPRLRWPKDVCAAFRPRSSALLLRDM